MWKTGAVANAPMLSGSVEEGAAHIPLFGEDCCVRRDGVYKDAVKLDTIGSILVVRYLLTAGTGQMQHTWLPYRDLKDGAQFSGFIKTNIEDKIAGAFQGKRDALTERLSALGASGVRKRCRAISRLSFIPCRNCPCSVFSGTGTRSFPRRSSSSSMAPLPHTWIWRPSPPCSSTSI